MIDVNNIGASLATKLGVAATASLYLIISLVFVIVAVVLLFLYFDKKSYNVTVIVLRPRGRDAFDFETGFIGKHYKDRSTKEVRFKLFQAKKKGVRYNNESIPEHFIIKRFFAGRYNPLIYMSPNSEGWLQPVQLSLSMQEGILASVKNADLSYYQTELELMDAMFHKKTFLEKYYLLILIFLLIVVVAIQWYAASQIHKAAEINLQQSEVWAQVMNKFIETIGNETGKAPAQVLNIGR
jgi:hypothetical protein